MSVKRLKPLLQNSLFEKFPSVFFERNTPASISDLPWGIECGDGWYKVIEKVASVFEAYNTSHPDLPPIRAKKVGEKFGALIFVVSHTPNYPMKRALNTAIKKSSETCEVCGNRGELVIKDHWHATRCKACKKLDIRCP